MFFEMRLLNDTSFMNNVYFICNGKEWGDSKTEGEIEWERADKEWEADGGWESVVASAINLTVGQVFVRALEKG